LIKKYLVLKTDLQVIKTICNQLS